MVTEVTATELAPRQDPREVGQERGEGTVDLDGTGAGSLTVSLSGELSTLGRGLLAEATAADGTAAVSGLTADSVTIDVTGGTADATDVAVSVTVSEDCFGVYE